MKQNTWIKIQIVSTSFKTSFDTYSVFLFWNSVGGSVSGIYYCLQSFLFYNFSLIGISGFIWCMCERKEYRMIILVIICLIFCYLVFPTFAVIWITHFIFFIYIYIYLNGLEFKVLSHKLRILHFYKSLQINYRERLQKRTVVNKFW